MIMSRKKWIGKRKPRDHAIQHRVPELGYYIIVTDTKNTEFNYINGLRDSIPEQLRGRLVIKVIKTETKSLVDETLDAMSKHAQFAEPWIIFDRDKVENFDQIISEAEKNGINVAWSNPCIEAWFYAYFGSMPTCKDSVDCCSKFGAAYQAKTGQKYDKSDNDIYEKLVRFGDEYRAIEIAEGRFSGQLLAGHKMPSEMCPTTTVHTLVRQIKNIVNEHKTE